MGLSAALSMALSGLSANQRGLQLTAQNVANANTEGYTAKRISQTATVGSGRVLGVSSSQIQRTLDVEIQSQLRVASSGSAYADRMNSYQSRLDELIGSPGGDISLDTLYNNFLGSLEGLATTPESYITRAETVNNAQALAQQLNGISSSIQTMRQENESFLRNSVDQINSALQGIKRLNDQILAEKFSAVGTADLEDQRDIFVDQLSEYMDIRVTEDDFGGLRLATDGGAVIFDRVAAVLQFNAKSTITPQTQYSVDPNKRAVGTVRMQSVSGLSVDLLQPGLLRNGSLAAARDLRDGVLVEAQEQLDQFAAAMASAIGDHTVAGTPAANGTQSGFDLDLSGLQNGNIATLTYQDNNSGETRVVSFVRVDEAASLPVSDDHTGRTDDVVIGIDFSGGTSSIISQINSALGLSMSATDQGGNIVRILDDGVSNRVDITSFDARVSATALTNQGTALPFFVDSGGATFTNSIDGYEQIVGFSGRIQINQSLLDDNTSLVVYQTNPTTLSGDSTRPQHLYDALSETSRTFTGRGGIGSSTSPFTGTVSSFAAQIISHRGAAAEAAERNADGQRAVTSTLEARFSETTEVSIDEEMARLVELQTAYAANARVMQVIQEMLDSLLRI